MHMSELSAAERREFEEYRRRKREEAERGVVDKVVVDLGDELLRPIAARMTGNGASALTQRSRGEFHERLRSVVDSGHENDLYERQKGWEKDPDYER